MSIKNNGEKKTEFSVNTRQNVQKHRNAEDNIIIKTN